MSQRLVYCQCAQCKKPITRGQRLRIIRETEDDDSSPVAVTHCDCNNPDTVGSVRPTRKLPPRAEDGKY